MQNSENKTIIQNRVQSLFFRFSNDFFALKKRSILHIENLTSNESFWSDQASSEQNAD